MHFLSLRKPHSGRGSASAPLRFPAAGINCALQLPVLVNLLLMLLGARPGFFRIPGGLALPRGLYAARRNGRRVRARKSILNPAGRGARINTGAGDIQG